MAQISASEVSIAHVGRATGKVGIALTPTKVSARQVSAGKVGPNQVGASQVGAAEFDAAKVGFWNVRIG